MKSSCNSVQPSPLTNRRRTVSFGNRIDKVDTGFSDLDAGQITDLTDFESEGQLQLDLTEQQITSSNPQVEVHERASTPALLVGQIIRTSLSSLRNSFRTQPYASLTETQQAVIAAQQQIEAEKEPPASATSRSRQESSKESTRTPDGALPGAAARRTRRTSSVLSRKDQTHHRWQEFVNACCGSLLLSKSRADMDDLKREAITDSHIVDTEVILNRLMTNVETGLSNSEVRNRITKFGLNKLKPPPTKPEWFKLLKQMVGGFCLLMWIGAALCFIAYGIQTGVVEDPPKDYIYLGAVLCAVVLITGIFSYYQEAKASNIMDSFTKFIPSFAIARRDGEDLTVPVEELVVGDIVKLKGGDKIPADCRIIQASNFRVDNSCLTGESEPQNRSPECTSENALETKNMTFFSTFAVEGNAMALVVATGDNTVMGRIARLTSGIEQNQTPLAQELMRFVHLISAFAVGVGIIFLIVILCLGVFWLDAIVFIIGIIVANVPEGLLIQVTICLSLTAKSMAKHNALVKNLEAVETLGSTSTICSDKTGTLTQNRMTVSHLWFNDTVYQADISIDQSKGKYGKNDPTWQALLRIIALCNRATFKPDQADRPIIERECIGDGSESGLLKFCEASLTTSTLTTLEYRRQCNKVIEIPFSSVTKFQCSIHEYSAESKTPYVLVMKGAPERIIDMCSTILLNGLTIEMTQEIKKIFNETYEGLGGMGERVLGFADLELPIEHFRAGFKFDSEPTPNFPTTGLRFVGLVSLIDPPRPAVPDAVRLCRAAGIRVIMVTGDHPITARAIAKAVGIVSTTSKTVEDLASERGVHVDQIDPKEAVAAVIHGAQLKEMTSEDLDAVIANHWEIVFARTSPQQKLQIVEGFQRAGAIVAVTGDGVNDSPALKKADIGIAMGITGTDVAMQAADMVLMDDNFATIVFAIEEGRVLFDNLKKCIAYILTSNIPELFAPLIYIIIGIPLPLGTIPMLCIDLGTDFVPAVTYAYEQAESDIMQRKPRHPVKDKMVNFRMISVAYGQNGPWEAAAGMMTYCVVMQENGFFPWRWYNLREEWESRGKTDLEDSYGQEWTYAQRRNLELTCYATYFLATVIMQWTNLVLCKTRRMSIFHQGWRNHWQTFGLVFETVVAVIIIYVPGLNSALSFQPVDGAWWSIAFPFALGMFLVDQCRKWAIRRAGPNSWWAAEFYF